MSSSPGLRRTPGKAFLSLLNWFARGSAVLVATIGFAVILGWLLDIADLKSVLPGFTAMKVNTACLLAAAGMSLWLLHTAPAKARSLTLGRGLALIVFTVGLLTLSEDLFAFDLGIDQLLLRDPQSPAGTLPGRMAPATSFNLLCIGLALLALKSPAVRLAAWAHWLVLPPLFLSALAIIGYCYGVVSLYKMGPYVSMAAHTAVSLFLLTLAVLAADSRHGFAKMATSDTAGGMVSRRLIPTLPVILFFLGWARLEGQRAGLYDFAFGLALMVVSSIVVCLVAVSWTAVTLHRSDGRRRRAEKEIMTLNAELELRVQERTQQLVQLSTDLGVANKSLEQLASEDALTRLANRRLFDTYLAAQIAVSHRHKRLLALVMCDVDVFKAYNDHYGHQAGDECLRQIAFALRSCCRRPADMAARYGGEEFALILPDTDLAGAALIGEAAREAVAQLRIPHDHSSVGPHVSISAGVAVLSRTIDMTAEQLIKAADEALYQAKDLGRNRIVIAPDKPRQLRVIAAQ